LGLGTRSTNVLGRLRLHRILMCWPYSSVYRCLGARKVEVIYLVGERRRSVAICLTRKGYTVQQRNLYGGFQSVTASYAISNKFQSGRQRLRNGLFCNQVAT